MEKVKCPYCYGQNIKKAGKLASGKQRYVCKDCKKGFSIGNVIKKPKVEDKCPYCGGELRTKGWNASGTRRYICKSCGKGCSENTIKIIPLKPENKECPYCHSTNTKKGGKLRDGSLRYTCNNCDKGFSEKTIVRDTTGIYCTHCGSSDIVFCGKDTKTGKQRYKCKECNVKFVADPTTIRYTIHEQTCPHCEHTQARKAGKSNGKQYYQCLNCGHKYLLDGKYKHLTEKQKQFIIQQTIKGKTVSTISTTLNCNEKTVRSVISNYSKNEKLTTQQIDTIIKYGVQLAVPIEYLYPYIPCTPQTCKRILKDFVIKQPIKKEITEREKAIDWLDLDRIIA